MSALYTLYRSYSDAGEDAFNALQVAEERVNIASVLVLLK